MGVSHRSSLMMVSRISMVSVLVTIAFLDTTRPSGMVPILPKFCGGILTDWLLVYQTRIVVVL